MSDSGVAQRLEVHKNKFKFDRDQFITDIQGFRVGCVKVGEKGLYLLRPIDGIRPSPSNLEQFNDNRLAQIHKWFWDQL